MRNQGEGIRTDQVREVMQYLVMQRPDILRIGFRETLPLESMTAVTLYPEDLLQVRGDISVG